MENKVFIVTSGTYSGYTIQAVFSTKEKAQEFINNRGDDGFNEIEEYEMDEPCERETSIYWCSVDTETNEITVESRNDGESEIYKEQKDTLYCRRSLFSNALEVFFYIETDTMDKARKITAERWQQVRALKDVCFPRLFEKCVVNRRLKYADTDYPVYNFITKQIILREGQTVVEDFEKEKKQLERQGIIVCF